MMSMLAVGAFVESSRRHGTARLKKRALKLMDHAHSAIQASLASNWVDVGLAQAAWVSVLPGQNGNVQPTLIATLTVHGLFRAARE